MSVAKVEAAVTQVKALKHTRPAAVVDPLFADLWYWIQRIDAFVTEIANPYKVFKVEFRMISVWQGKPAREKTVIHNYCRPLNDNILFPNIGSSVPTCSSFVLIRESLSVVILRQILGSAEEIGCIYERNSVAG